jgi:5-methylcytosine-specific restriction endonuclease McrA
LSARRSDAADLLALVRDRLLTDAGYALEARVLDQAIELLREDVRKQQQRSTRFARHKAYWAKRDAQRAADRGTTSWLQLRAQIFERDGNRCAYCGIAVTAVSGHVDHVMPRSRGGSDEPSNLVASCKPCNLSKGARTPEEWRQ